MGKIRNISSLMRVGSLINAVRSKSRLSRFQTPPIWLGALSLVVLTACSAPSPASPLPEDQGQIASEDLSLSIAEDEPATASLLPEEKALSFMEDLTSGDPEAAQEAIERILDSHDDRFIAVFLELMRASQIGIVRNARFQDYIDAMEILSGQEFGRDWPAWIEWYGSTDLQPPPGFTSWKGRLLARIDPGFGEFLRDELASRIRVEEIQWGGVLVDGIPALDNADMIPPAEADYLEPGEPVFGVTIEGESRAYPLRIVDWHEMANDVVGGVPVSLAYCTLCGAGVLYDGRASNGQTYTFGSSGFLFRSNKLMYDRQTRTLWNQLTGEPVLGELAGEDVKLALLPVVLTSWESWLEQHPDTKVLDIETGFPRPYDLGAAYGDYFSSEVTMFPVWQRSDLLDGKDRVFVIQIEGVPKAYPLDLLTEQKVVNDEIGQIELVVVATRGTVTVDGINQRVGAVTYDAGGEVRVYQRLGETFTPGPNTENLHDTQGGLWQITEEGLVGPEGEFAPRISGHLAYWFGWFAFFPNTLLYEAP